MKNFSKLNALGCAPYKKNAVNKLSQNNNGHERERAENSIKKIQLKKKYDPFPLLKDKVFADLKILVALFFCCLVGETITGRIEDPWVVVRTLHAGVKAEDLSWQFSCGQWASIGQGAERLSFNVAFLLPLLEVSQSAQFSGVLHPLDNLQHGDEVDVIASNHLIHKLDEFILELFLALEPRSSEVETQWGAVGAQMAVNVVAEHPTELFTSGDVGARIDHVASGQGLVECGVVTTIELVDDHLPDGVAAAGAVLGIADALVRHAEVERVRPDGNAAKRGGDG